MKITAILITFLLSNAAGHAAEAANANPNPKPAESPPPAAAPIQYPSDPDSSPQEGVPKGKLEGPLMFKSQIFTNTIRTSKTKRCSLP